MIDPSPFTLRPQPPRPDGFELTSSGRNLLDALDTWLADDQFRDDYVHVHSWTDGESTPEVRS